MRELVAMVLLCAACSAGGASTGTESLAGAAGSGHAGASGAPAGASGAADDAGTSGAAGSAGGGGATVYCVPGATAVCACSDPVRVGVQECLADGSGYSACECAAGGAGAAGSAGTSGSAGSSGSAGEAGSSGSSGATSCPAPAPYQDQTCLEYAGGTHTCSSGACQPCDVAAMDCDGDPSNGCETMQTDTHCGLCNWDCTKTGEHCTYTYGATSYYCTH